MFSLRISDRIARLTLDRAAARNAIPIAGWDTLAEQLGTLDDGGARVLVLGSAVPGTFCAGADIADLRALLEDAPLRAVFRKAMRKALARLAALPIPTIAAIDGGCFGAGVALAIACDIRIAGPAARFAVTPARLGISYPQEDVARLADLIGPGQAARLLLAADTIDRQEALRIGLVEEASEDVAAAVDALAAAIARNAASSLRLLKDAIRRAAAGERQGPACDAAFDHAFHSTDFAEGVAAFLDKRAPEFGR